MYALFILIRLKNLPLVIFWPIEHTSNELSRRIFFSIHFHLLFDTKGVVKKKIAETVMLLPFSCISFPHNPEFRTSHRAVLWNYYSNPKVRLHRKNLTTKICYCSRALRATVSQRLRCTINTARAALLTQSSSHTVATRGCQKISTSKFKTILERNWQTLSLFKKQKKSVEIITLF